MSTEGLQKFGTAGYQYRGVSIRNRSGSRGRKMYEVDVTKFATEQFRSQFFESVERHKLFVDTLAKSVAMIDEMFESGDLA